MRALDASGKRRSARDVAMSVQRYLLFAILACVPDRQRTLRELQLNKTLFQDPSSERGWFVTDPTITRRAARTASVPRS